MSTCEICGRTGDDSQMEKHHLHPGKHRRKKVGREEDVALVCETCGDQIHQMFTNSQLRDELSSIEALRAAMQTYISWVRKKPIEASVTMKRKKRHL